MKKAGRPRKYSIQDAYDLYEQQYEKLKKQQQKRGQSPKYSKMSLTDFVEDWEENRAHYGPKYSGKQVAEALAKKDVYQHSYAQGKALYTALSADVDFEGLNISQRSFALQHQKGIYDDSLKGFWNMITEHTNALEQEGYSKLAICKEIGQLFFGS